MGERRERGLKGLHQAFDEVRFGPSRTLNLRSALPTAADASHRVRNWLRQQQVAGAKEVLVVTGRGNNSDDGVPVVKDACVRVFHELRRKNVIVSFSEHTPGSFVVALAPMSALLEAGRRRRDRTPMEAAPNRAQFRALDRETLARLRSLAERSLDALGVREREQFIEDEMLRLLDVLAGSVREGPDRERRLRMALAAAMRDFD